MIKGTEAGTRVGHTGKLRDKTQRDLGGEV